jgi:heterokaryon incompatibility protein (HET)
MYNFKPLNHSNREIRLIQIDEQETAKSRDGAFKYSLVHTSLLLQPSFSALSYVWGEPSLTENIWLDGILVPVTTNLAAALKHSHHHWMSYFPDRSPSEFRVWADAICINQKDVMEKNVQVPLMAAIYSSADMVIAWLGSMTPDIELAFGTFEQIWSEFSDQSDEEIAKLAWLEKHPNLYQDDLDPDTANPLLNKGWASTCSLFDIPYWRRVWIFQESALAKTMILCAGIIALYYEKVELVWFRMQALRASIQIGTTKRPAYVHNSVWEFLSSDFNTWRTIQRINGGKIRACRLALSEQDPMDTAAGWMLSLTGRSYLATDPRDHIYGLLALTNIDIVPDYSPEKSVGEVYRDYVDALLRTYDLDWETFGVATNRLSFLYYAGIGIFDNVLSLPSWAPNYQEDSQKGLTGFWISAGADSGVFHDSISAPMVKELILVVTGVNIDSISRVENAPHEDTWFDGSMLGYFKDFVTRNPMYVGGIPPLQAILRAIKLDSTCEVNEGLVLYAYNMLQFFLAVDQLNLKTHLEELGIGTGKEFDTNFPDCVFPDFKTSKGGWWKNFLAEPTDSSNEYRTELRFTVISDLTWLRKRWRFCETTTGYFGLAPLNTRPGDLVCIIDGCHTPVIMRKKEDQYLFVGCCFIVGLMTGEAKQLVESRSLDVQKFEMC